MNNSDKLNKYIAILKERFPNYAYVNTVIDECPESTLTASVCDYTIIVKNVPKSKFRELSSYVDEHILYDLIEKNEPLPCVIMLQKEDISFSLWNSIVTSSDQYTTMFHTPEFPDVDISSLKKDWQRQSIKGNVIANNQCLNYDADYRLAA